MRIFVKSILSTIDGNYGDYLDIERQDIGLKSNNNLFVLQLKYDRSFSFIIPATDKNNRILFNSNRVDFSLRALRRNIPAVMYVADKQIDGFLKILSATQNRYNAVFYYNQIFPFDVSQKIATYLNLSDSLNWNAAATVYDGGGAGLPPVSFGLYRYRTDAGRTSIPADINYLPSVTMKRLLDECAAASGINYHFDITDPTELLEKQARFVRLMIKLKSAKAKRIIKTEVTVQSDSVFVRNYPLVVYTVNLLTPLIVYSYVPLLHFCILEVYALKFLRDCRLTFNNLPTSHNWGVLINTDRYIAINNGTTITLEAEDSIIFYNRDRLFGLEALQDAYNETFRFNFELTEGMMAYGDVYFLQSNLPDVTYVDLLTTTAYALGLSLTSDIANSRFVLSDYTLASSPTLTIDSVTVRDEHLIEIDDLGISGIVDFDSSSWVLEEMKLKLTIGSGEGNNIRLPFSEERKYRDTEDVFIRDLTFPGTISNSEKDVLCIYNKHPNIYLQRFDFMDSRLPSIINSGIIVSLKIAQSPSKFLELSATTKIIYKNKAFAIVEATNKDNVTSLKMIRLD